MYPLAKAFSDRAKAAKTDLVVMFEVDTSIACGYSAMFIMDVGEAVATANMLADTGYSIELLTTNLYTALLFITPQGAVETVWVIASNYAAVEAVKGFIADLSTVHMYF